jgi:hypothetical protein
MRPTPCSLLRFITLMMTVSALVADDHQEWQSLSSIDKKVTHVVPAFWTDCPPLNAGAKIKILDVDGPGVVTFIHLSNLGTDMGVGFDSPEVQSVTIRIFYDGEKKAAVEMPLMDFMGDIQCKSVYFNTVYFSKVKESHNFRLPLPFRKHITIEVENPSRKNIVGYADVQWDSVRSIPAECGYLQTDYRAGNLDPAISNILCDIHRPGSIVAHWLQYESVRSSHGETICEANQEIHIDGDAKPTVNYLGTEDVYGYSWGFKKTDSDNYDAIIKLEDMHGGGSRVAMLRCRPIDRISFMKSCQWILTFAHDPGAQQALTGSTIPFRHCVYFYANTTSTPAASGR